MSKLQDTARASSAFASTCGEPLNVNIIMTGYAVIGHRKRRGVGEIVRERKRPDRKRKKSRRTYFLL